MEKKITAILPTQSLIFIGICSVSILAFFILIIFPNQKSDKAFDKKIETTQREIEKQKAFLPLYHEFREILQASKNTEMIHLPFPENARSKPGDIYQVQSTLKDISNQNRLTIDKIDPDVSSIVEESGILKVNLSVIGDFNDFRDFMVQLNKELPAIEHIEQMRIQRVDDSKHYQLEIEIWIAQG